MTTVGARSIHAAAIRMMPPANRTNAETVAALLAEHVYAETVS